MPDEHDKAEAVDADRIDPDDRGDDEQLTNYPPDRLLRAMHLERDDAAMP